jgi:hypothetical protein
VKNRKHIRIYSHELHLEIKGKKTFLVITEVRSIDLIPLRTYYYRMPEKFRWDYATNKRKEKYYPLHPN